MVKIFDAVVKGNLVVSALQGAVIGIVFWLCGLSTPLLWGAVAAPFALILVGTEAELLGSVLTALAALSALYFLLIYTPGVNRDLAATSEWIERIRRDLGTAVVLITHDLGVVARIADRVQVMYAGRPVERGLVLPVFEHPSHPYTQGLLASLPGAGRERLQPIPGAPPNMLQPPSGCAFRARCPHAIAACAEIMPDLMQVGVSETACIRAEELELQR